MRKPGDMYPNLPVKDWVPQPGDMCKLDAYEDYGPLLQRIWDAVGAQAPKPPSWTSFLIVSPVYAASNSMYRLKPSDGLPEPMVTVVPVYNVGAPPTLEDAHRNPTRVALPVRMLGVPSWWEPVYQLRYYNKDAAERTLGWFKPGIVLRGSEEIGDASISCCACSEDGGSIPETGHWRYKGAHPVVITPTECEDRLYVSWYERTEVHFDAITNRNMRRRAVRAWREENPDWALTYNQSLMAYEKSREHVLNRPAGFNPGTYRIPFIVARAMRWYTWTTPVTDLDVDPC